MGTREGGIFIHIFESLKKASAKDKNVYKNIVAAFGIKGIALLISLYTMPAYMRYFADQRILGVWYTILSVLTWILNFDLGIGNGLRNKLSASLALDDQALSRKYIASAYGMIGAAVLFLTIATRIVLPFCNWNTIFNVDVALIPAADLQDAIWLTLIGMLFQFFLRLISSILYAMQMASVNNLLTLITSVMQLLFALFAPNFGPVKNLVMFSGAYVVCVNLPLIITTIAVFAGPLKRCRPRIKDFEMQRAKEVLSLGGMFFFCQILYMIIANTNEFFISHYTGSADVVDYQIYYKLFSMAGVLMTLALSPIWSAVTKAIAEKDFSWLQVLYTRLKKISFIAIAGEFFLIIILQFLINIWLGEEAIQVDYIYALIFAFFGSAMLYQSMLSSFVCGMGRMKLQAICYSAGMVLKIVIIHVGSAITKSWIIVPLANALILVPYCILQQINLDRYMTALRV